MLVVESGGRLGDLWVKDVNLLWGEHLNLGWGSWGGGLGSWLLRHLDLEESLVVGIDVVQLDESLFVGIEVVSLHLNLKVKLGISSHSSGELNVLNLDWLL